jgi:sterol desaturase/sphingolipid hydroxylase (fatty acid hydroxylase superfamily)
MQLAHMLRTEKRSVTTKASVLYDQFTGHEVVMKRSKAVPPWLSAVLVGGTLGALILLERRRPLRRRTNESKLRRDARNLAVATLAAATVHLVEKPLTLPLMRLVEGRRFGLLKQLPLPVWMEVPLAVGLLDYTLYLWHILTHEVPFLWRFHQVHHVDLDMDASTALRFHSGEVTASVAWRAAQIVLIGVSPLALSIWELALLLEIMFHHSNVELPPAAERWLGKLIVTPRMHGIHHSIVARGNQLELVQRSDGMGPAARDAPAGRAAGASHNRGARISRSEGCDLAKNRRHALRSAAAQLATAREQRTRSRPHRRNQPMTRGIRWVGGSRSDCIVSSRDSDQIRTRDGARSLWFERTLNSTRVVFSLCGPRTSQLAQFGTMHAVARRALPWRFWPQTRRARKYDPITSTAANT